MHRNETNGAENTHDGRLLENVGYMLPSAYSLI